jgi:hypothetical protein
MTQRERAELLRQRFRALGGIPYKAKGATPQKEHLKPPTPFRLALFAVTPTEHRHAWIATPDEKEPPHVEMKHRTGVPALTLIAAKWEERDVMPCTHAALSKAVSKRRITSSKLQT